MKQETKQLRKGYHHDQLINGIFYGILITGFTCLAFLETHTPASAMLWGLTMANLFVLGAYLLTATLKIDYENQHEPKNY